MALNYDSIPGKCYCRRVVVKITNEYLATSVAVEHIFSRARRLITWECNRLSSQSIRALMCVGAWSLMDLINEKDILAVTCEAIVPPKDKSAEEVELPEDFDVIYITDDKESDGMDVDT